MNCGPAAWLELFTRPDGLRPLRATSHTVIFSLAPGKRQIQPCSRHDTNAYWISKTWSDTPFLVSNSCSAPQITPETDHFVLEPWQKLNFVDQCYRHVYTVYNTPTAIHILTLDKSMGSGFRRCSGSSSSGRGSSSSCKIKPKLIQ